MKSLTTVAITGLVLLVVSSSNGALAPDIGRFRVVEPNPIRWEEPNPRLWRTRPNPRMFRSLPEVGRWRADEPDRSILTVVEPNPRSWRVRPHPRGFRLQNGR